MGTRTKMNFTDYRMFEVVNKYLATNPVPAEFIAEVMGDAYDADKHTPEELNRKVSHKFHVLRDNAAKPKAPSKAAVLNKAIAEKVYNAHVGGDAFTLADIMAEHPNEVKTYGKAAAVLNVLTGDGRAAKTAPIDNKTAYQIKA